MSEGEPSFLSLKVGGAANPDRVSNRRKRQERIQPLMTSSSHQKWWLDIESGMLTRETLDALMEYQKKAT